MDDTVPRSGVEVADTSSTHFNPEYLRTFLQVDALYIPSLQSADILVFSISSDILESGNLLMTTVLLDVKEKSEYYKYTNKMRIWAVRDLIANSIS